MTKKHSIVKKSNRNINLGDKMSQTSEKNTKIKKESHHSLKKSKNVNLGDKKSQTSEQKTKL